MLSLFSVAIWVCLVGLLAMIGGMQYKIGRLEEQSRSDKNRLGYLEADTYDLEREIDSLWTVVDLLEKNQNHIQDNLDELCKGIRDFVKEAAEVRVARRDLEKLEESVSKWYGLITNDMRDLYNEVKTIGYGRNRHNRRETERCRAG